MKSSEILYLLARPQELRSIIQWKLWHQPVHERDPTKESPELHKCFFYLDMTSRSFSAVIKELHPELLVPICIFYLILRGLDTIEDDMTIPLEEKVPLLENFVNILDQPGWTYSGNHEREKDRDLLVEFHYVITEFGKLKPAYRDIIRDITERMGAGMARYAQDKEHVVAGIQTIKDYEQYCHYVAGLVGEGLTRLFVEGKLANEMLMERPDLHESMGQLLQQVNIIRDIHEDFVDHRKFWPREIWSKHVDKFEDLLDPAHRAAALNCSSDMILNALRRAPDCIYYLAGIRDQSVFNFCAIPQSMAMATLSVCFRNPALFERNVKISKGEACQLMMESTQNLETVCGVFRRFARKIHQKNDPRDPNFLQISIACGKIEQFIEGIFPSQVPGATAVGQGATPEALEKKKAEEAESRWDMVYMMLAVLATLATVTLLMLGVAWLAGARFDLAFEQIKQGNFKIPAPAEAAKQVQEARGHGEL
ncbi:farnesyl-diphosphate farnesyltransferase [Trichodelitschia bisporula]|uniref:Squalene synthase n=1 Tax=Trichodelitschia bisporula TaxID=703511 RepID=A0A6G1I3A8_9PEZI|nr:farnesyl-diphosphate farnesyltransferase [Trichodelitschia bisporula]